LWLRMSSSITKTGSFSDVINGWEVIGSPLGQDLLIRFSAPAKPVN